MTTWRLTADYRGLPMIDTPLNNTMVPPIPGQTAAEVKARYALIVRAVNSHDSLRQALQALVDDWESDPTESLAKACAVLAALEGQP